MIISTLRSSGRFWRNCLVLTHAVAMPMTTKSASSEVTINGANGASRPFGPAGAATYTPPAIDAKRGLPYATTAEEYGFLDPSGPYSVIAYDLASGALYVPVSDDGARPPHRPGGLAARDPASGAVPGAIFARAWDGRLRNYSSGDGSLIRDIDTGNEFAAANGKAARGGQVSGYPVVVGQGGVYVTSGASSVLRPGDSSEWLCSRALAAPNRTR
jgi:polyvinyl alcohol dehydrogenase (cytochrome)